MPVYNERATFTVVVEKLLALRIEGIDLEIIIVESNSTDGTRDLRVSADRLQMLADASAVVLDGFRLRSDAKIVRYPDRYEDERGRTMWQTVWEIMDELQRQSPLLGVVPQSEGELADSADAVPSTSVTPLEAR